jgi:hypothetical protein
MIKLVVEDYCQDCPEFEAHVEKDVYVEDSPIDFRRLIRSKNTITCVHKDRCELVKTYLKNQIKEKEKKTNDQN